MTRSKYHLFEPLNFPYFHKLFTSCTVHTSRRRRWCLWLRQDWWFSLKSPRRSEHTQSLCVLRVFYTKIIIFSVIDCLFKALSQNSDIFSLNERFSLCFFFLDSDGCLVVLFTSSFHFLSISVFSFLSHSVNADEINESTSTQTFKNGSRSKTSFSVSRPSCRLLSFSFISGDFLHPPESGSSPRPVPSCSITSAPSVQRNRPEETEG